MANTGDAFPDRSGVYRSIIDMPLPRIIGISFMTSDIMDLICLQMLRGPHHPYTCLLEQHPAR
jgi:hypothetical protein